MSLPIASVDWTPEGGSLTYGAYRVVSVDENKIEVASGETEEGPVEAFYIPWIAVTSACYQVEGVKLLRPGQEEEGA